MVIAHREFDGTDGLCLENGRIILYAQGHEIAHARAPEGAELRDLLLTYRVPAIFPHECFCLTKPQYFDVSVTIAPLGLADDITGLVELNGVEHLWVAQYRRHPDFRRFEEVPEGQRPWADPEKGWEFILPASIQSHPDVLVPKRLALLLEGFLCSMIGEHVLKVPYVTSFDNVFSADSPAWRVNLPRLISIEERGQLDLV
jgi:hypothetical protein